MTASIIALLAALIPFLIWWVKRRAAKKDDPINQHAERQQKIDAQIVEAQRTGDGAALTAGADSDLDALERLQNKNRGDQR